MPVKGELLYEGKAKRVYRTDDPDHYLVEFKDEATAFDGLKKGTIARKGEINTRLSALFFQMLAGRGIPTHFIEQTGPREMLVRAVDIIPVEVVARNIAAGSLAKRLGLAEGEPLKRPVLEFYYKSDELHDPMINNYHIAALELAAGDQVEAMEGYAWKVNELLTEFLKPANLVLVDFKLEFGLHHGQVLLADEISPDTCRFWDSTSGEKLDKDRFRRDLGGVEDAYEEVLRRVERLCLNLESVG
ncbi:phosphoribosylaminoimidazolesuccinocarboxamide synthase [Neomoorella thermoacetica]|uniref:Phosphoribosylaminoimidazole-succinocarboxamide synthase n=3 Tax=Neomoorella thermoacetica TaxID=1525 RepID=A0AAC9HJL1_NEOTH|nr:phosphoribosylaminoimidazolesuccinocarboxamide synthase [Moorella thermoacetica]AKX94882.1 phosphoribosylaminoimidazole-succinocarboxamide synthase [Moorella thermoacetica]AKX97512.1 phosphoribosylaminoimidazole-succinocarboxamide synthase [Moorella thermoacetica]AOQ25014.1 Phosphoribosylaminoimidazole-succinocarboxamide synthase [Moorella thermoacetica]OIQ54772.1 phosphoribosylaminoimidazole-succinocarboxamide synthase [Moorella thermoacetica]OIQ57069.1 phosphoribosylaminoimidazole-succino